MTRDTFDMFQEPERGRFGENEQQIRPGRGPRVTGASDLVDITLTLRDDTKPLAIGVSDPATPGGKWIWLPRSQVEVAVKAANLVSVAMPAWLAKAKGLI
jgi:hypothetical protein